MNEKKDLIENIKKEYLEQKNTKHKVINGFWGQYQEMARELSEGIYAEDNHFIYELIQNAEDTISKEKEHILEFILEDNGLIVFNNEKGFTEEQIKAICAFGKSTKAKDKNQGYIGEKGIGFKSVFKITDKPAIFSNGYRFYFRRLDKKGTTEYIIPHWINDNELKKYPQKFQNNTHTTLYLPFSKEKKAEQIKKLKEDIIQIEPILLLFLKRLTNIKIIESDQKVINTKKVSKNDENLKLITIKNENVSNKYYIFKKSINVDQNLDEVKDKNGRRKDIKKREIILAFPHGTNQTKEDRIFSFLPTKLHSELNFIIQADFILQSGRENIAIDNEWNQWQFKEIEKFVCNEVVNKLKEHSKLRFIYLNYFLKNGNSHNELIEKLYESIINILQDDHIILSENNTWQKPANIILLEDAELETKYIKLLFGKSYEQVHKKFELNKYFIEQFDIRSLNKKEIIEKICDYFDKKDLNDYDEEIVFELTKFLSKYLNTDSRAYSYERELYNRVKKSLPIIPKYKNGKKFYLYDPIYISSEYKPKFLIENIAEEKKFDFVKYNFLSNDYLEDKRLTDFIKNIINEQEKDKNKKTIEFFTKYPNILQDYLKRNIKNHYKKILDYLIEIQEDNKERISKIPLLLTQDNEFFDSAKTIYFSDDSENKNIKVLDKNLIELIKKEHKYKEFLEKIFKVKEADILNIIINEYLPWIKENYYKRNPNNDKKLLKYTKEIIENFDKFEKEDKERIKQSLCFISSNQRDKYVKSSCIYLSQNFSEIIFNTNSIEKYITDKSYFDFLDERYNEIAEVIDEDKMKAFFKIFSFEKYIKKEDVVNFVKFIKNDLELDSNIEVLEFVVKSIDRDRKKINEIENFKVYSQNNNIVEIKNIFQNKIEDLNIDYLHKKYHQKIGKSNLENIKQYFQPESKIEPFVSYLKRNIDFEEVIKVYTYLDKKSELDPNNRKSKNNYTITIANIRNKFKNEKLILNKNGERFYPSDTTWKEEKSGNKLFALSAIYPEKLQNFFVKKVQVSQTKDIRQIINHIKQDMKEKSDDYFDLLIDLTNLVINDTEIDKYYDSFQTKPPIKNKYEDMRKFILEKEQVFILDNGKKNIDGNFYFNDLDIDICDESLKKKVFSILDSKYPIKHFLSLIEVLKIKRLSDQKIEKKFITRLSGFSIKDWRELLNFAYDLLFTKYKNKYDSLEEKKEKLRDINLLNSINIYEKVETNITIDEIKLNFKNKNEMYLFEDRELKIVDKNLIFKIIAEKIGDISDKDIKDFYNEVIKGKKEKEEYYKNEDTREKQNFYLEISDEAPVEIKKDTNIINSYEINKYNDNDEKKKNEENNIDQNDQISAEAEREQRRKSGAEQVKDYNKNIMNDTNEISPSSLMDTQKYQNQYIRERKEKLRKISTKSKRISRKIKEKMSNANEIDYKIGEEETKNFFRRKDQYLGQCQICGFTFKTKNGTNYCERFTWSDYKRVKTKTNLIDPGNSLCLCAKCHSIIKGGGDFEATFLTDEIVEMFKVLKDDYDFDTFIEDIDSDKPLSPPECFKEHLDFEDIYFVDIRLNNKDERIYFTEEHLLMFYEFLKSGE